MCEDKGGWPSLPRGSALTAEPVYITAQSGSCCIIPRLDHEIMRARQAGPGGAIRRATAFHRAGEA